MIRSSLFLLAAALLSNLVHGQTCDCKANFEWVKETFGHNDAGAQYIIDKKGRDAYEDLNKKILEKAIVEKDKAKCLDLLRAWLNFFRHGHVEIRSIDNGSNNSASTSASAPSSASASTSASAPGSLSASISASAADPNPFANWETVKEDLPKFEKYIQDKSTPDFEGIWESPPYKIGIKRYGKEYKGFIIESGADTWTRGQIKLRITRDSGMTHTVYYLRDHSPQEPTNTTLVGKNHLQVGTFWLTRVNSRWKDDQDVVAFFKAAEAQKPFLDQLNSTTLYLRIPSFGPMAKSDIDSVLAANRSRILSTDNLIIDISSGTGGNDASFENILPIIYTNPIRTVGTEFYSTPLNNSRMIDIINNPKWGVSEEGKKWAKAGYDKLNTRLGQFVNLDTTDVTIDKFDTIYPYPKNVGIIMNDHNGSSDEQFLLSVKQSRKVKLFGATSMGALDMSNMYYVPNPCHEFELGYCLSRSMRIPGMAIDGTGIQPDYYIDKTIPRYRWIAFVSDVLNGK